MSDRLRVSDIASRFASGVPTTDQSTPEDESLVSLHAARLLFAPDNHGQTMVAAPSVAETCKRFEPKRRPNKPSALFEQWHNRELQSSSTSMKLTRTSKRWVRTSPGPVPGVHPVSIRQSRTRAVPHMIPVEHTNLDPVAIIKSKFDSSSLLRATALDNNVDRPPSGPVRQSVLASPKKRDGAHETVRSPPAGVPPSDPLPFASTSPLLARETSSLETKETAQLSRDHDVDLADSLSPSTNVSTFSFGQLASPTERDAAPSYGDQSDALVVTALSPESSVRMTRSPTALESYPESPHSLHLTTISSPSSPRPTDRSPSASTSLSLDGGTSSMETNGTAQISRNHDVDLADTLSPSTNISTISFGELASPKKRDAAHEADRSPPVDAPRSDALSFASTFPLLARETPSMETEETAQISRNPDVDLADSFLPSNISMISFGQMTSSKKLDAAYEVDRSPPVPARPSDQLPFASTSLSLARETSSMETKETSQLSQDHDVDLADSLSPSTNVSTSSFGQVASPTERDAAPSYDDQSDALVGTALSPESSVRMTRSPTALESYPESPRSLHLTTISSPSSRSMSAVAMPDAAQELTDSTNVLPSIDLYNYPVIKHGRYGQPKRILLTVDMTDGTIRWGAGRRRVIRVEDVRQVRSGKQTAVLERRSAKYSDETLCMSIVTRDRTLDLQLRTKEEKRSVMVSLMNQILAYLKSNNVQASWARPANQD